MAIRSLQIWDAHGAKEWLRLAKQWETYAVRYGPASATPNQTMGKTT